MKQTESFTKVLAAEHAAQAAAWQPPTVDGPRAGRTRLTAAELEGIERAAWDEGYSKGEAAGLAAGEKEMKRRIDEQQKQVQQLASILQAMAKPLTQLDDDIEQQLVTLALTIAKQLVRRELRIDPTQVIAIVRETVALLPLGQRNVRVHLHPLDAALVRERLSEPQSQSAWSLVEDPVMSRGGCRVSTDTTQIDARLETRITSVLNHLLGDDRVSETRGDDANDNANDKAAS